MKNILFIMLVISSVFVGCNSSEDSTYYQKDKKITIAAKNFDSSPTFHLKITITATVNGAENVIDFGLTDINGIVRGVVPINQELVLNAYDLDNILIYQQVISANAIAQQSQIVIYIPSPN